MQQFKFGQWVLEVNEDKYELYNPDPETGKKRFYRAVPGEFGQPLLESEPDLAFAVPEELTYVNNKGEPVKPNQKIAGIICKDDRPRFSLTNAKSKGVVVNANEDGSIQVGEEKWWLATLFLKDKNRIFNYDAYCVREMPSKVRVLELGDLDLF